MDNEWGWKLRQWRSMQCLTILKRVPSDHTHQLWNTRIDWSHQNVDTVTANNWTIDNSNAVRDKMDEAIDNSDRAIDNASNRIWELGLSTYFNCEMKLCIIQKNPIETAVMKYSGQVIRLFAKVFHLSWGVAKFIRRKWPIKLSYRLTW